MSSDGTYKWLVVAMLWSVCFLNYADRQVIFTVFPLLGSEFHLVQRLALGPERFVYVHLCAFWSACRTDLRSFSASDPDLRRADFLVVDRGSDGFRAQLRAACCLCCLRRFRRGLLLPGCHVDDRRLSRRGHEIARHVPASISVYIGSIAGGAIAGYPGQFYGWRTGFRWFGSVGIVLGCALWLLLKEPRRGQSDWRPENYRSGGGFWRDCTNSRATAPPGCLWRFSWAQTLWP